MDRQLRKRRVPEPLRPRRLRLQQVAAGSGELPLGVGAHWERFRLPNRCRLLRLHRFDQRQQWKLRRRTVPRLRAQHEHQPRGVQPRQYSAGGLSVGGGRGVLVQGGDDDGDDKHDIIGDRYFDKHHPDQLKQHRFVLSHPHQQHLAQHHLDHHGRNTHRWAVLGRGGSAHPERNVSRSGLHRVGYQQSASIYSRCEGSGRHP
mmetsp:Transcript_40713/g.116933  ORF Transcript_40713/g.116933 Transcript_40713/m.116933 type:complete len:203 (+) Transcript_40713:342-950(+)